MRYSLITFAGILAFCDAPDPDPKRRRLEDECSSLLHTSQCVAHTCTGVYWIDDSERIFASALPMESSPFRPFFRDISCVSATGGAASYDFNIKEAEANLRTMMDIVTGPLARIVKAFPLFAGDTSDIDLAESKMQEYLRSPAREVRLSLLATVHSNEFNELIELAKSHAEGVIFLPALVHRETMIRFARIASLMTTLHLADPKNQTGSMANRFLSIMSKINPHTG